MQPKLELSPTPPSGSKNSRKCILSSVELE
uniref:Uncharacterized protein n=1 Tax=Anguilla anguilla TaxID=7936 RepID=A0A0E9WNH4_ANGAN